MVEFKSSLCIAGKLALQGGHHNNPAAFLYPEAPDEHRLLNLAAFPACATF
jgi:hypothetical protein